MPGLRHVSCGKFLDYGPYASFAPTFDQDGTEVGRYALGEVIWRQRQEASLREKTRGKRKAIESLQAADGDEVVLVGEEPQNAGVSVPETEIENAEELDKALQSLVPAEEVARIKAALGSLEMEQAVQELLDKNARALRRLQRLQRLRLGAEGGGSSKVEEESEEWDTGMHSSTTCIAFNLLMEGFGHSPGHLGLVNVAGLLETTDICRSSLEPSTRSTCVCAAHLTTQPAARGHRGLGWNVAPRSRYCVKG